MRKRQIGKLLHKRNLRRKELKEIKNKERLKLNKISLTPKKQRRSLIPSINLIFLLLLTLR